MLGFCKYIIEWVNNHGLEGSFSVFKFLHLLLEYYKEYGSNQMMDNEEANRD